MRRNDAERLVLDHEKSLARMGTLYKELNERAKKEINERILRQRTYCAKAMRRIEEVIASLAEEEYYRKISRADKTNSKNKLIKNQKGPKAPPRTVKNPHERRR